MSNHLKQITTQAKRIRKSNPGLPWTECVSQASRDLGYGSSVGKKPKYRVYATEIKRKTKTQAKAKKVAPKPIVKAKAMTKAKPLVKAKKVYTKKEIDKVLDKIDPGKTIKKPVVKAKKTTRSKGDNLPLKHLFNTKTPAIAIEEFEKGNIVEIVDRTNRIPVYHAKQIRPSRYTEYWSIYKPNVSNNAYTTRGVKKETYDADKPLKNAINFGKQVQWAYNLSTIPPISAKPLAMTKDQYYMLQNATFSVYDKRALWNAMILAPTTNFQRLFQKYNQDSVKNKVSGINQKKLDQVIATYLVPGGLYAGQVKFRSKILYGEPIVLVETNSGQPIDKIYADDYEEARLLAMVLNEKSQSLRKASMNGNLKRKIKNIGNITLK